MFNPATGAQSNVLDAKNEVIFKCLQGIGQVNMVAGGLATNIYERMSEKRYVLRDLQSEIMV